MPRQIRSPSVPRKIGKHTAEEMKNALNLIRSGSSIKKAAKTTGIPFTTLKSYHNKTKTCESLENQRLEPNYTVNKIFTPEQEQTLKDYFNHCALIFYGLTKKECQKVAFQCAKMNNLKMPQSWIENQRAGKDWLMAFRKRHGITLRKPEPCSLARATAFNQNNVKRFYDNLEELVSRHPSFGDGTRIFNLDETSTTTVQKPQRVIAPKGKKTVSKVTSGERGTLVTTCCIISASGNFLPPVMVFPRKNFKDHMIKNTPPGTLGLASPTGWMNSSIFPEVMKHFIKHTNSSKENPSILIMDNHESHLCIEALELAKNSGVHILTLHPHTSGKLQPLDVGIYSPFKVFYNAAIDSWLLRNPGKPVTIYELGEIIGTAFQKAMTPSNITHSFAKCGIFPFDRHQFTEEDFLPSSVTDRPCPDCLPRADDTEPEKPRNAPKSLATTTVHTAPVAIPGPSREKTMPCPENLLIRAMTTEHTASVAMPGPCPKNPAKLSEIASLVVSKLIHCELQTAPLEGPDKELLSNKYVVQQPSAQDIVTPKKAHELDSTSSEHTVQTPVMQSPLKSLVDNFISPFDFRNPIKAGPRQSNRKRRKAGRSLIATDTPEKLLLEQVKIGSKKKKDVKKRKVNRKVLQSEDEEEEEEMVLADSDNDWEELEELEDIEEEENIITLTEKSLRKPLCRRPREGEYVLVQFATKKRKSWYIGKVLDERNDDLEYYISFLRYRNQKFVVPDKPDLSLIKENDIKFICPRPSVVGSSSRPFYKFPIVFSGIKIC